MQEPSGDDLHDRYIELVANNWTEKEYRALVQYVRRTLMERINHEDPSWGYRFTYLWRKSITLRDEIVWAGYAVGVEQPDAD